MIIIERKLKKILIISNKYYIYNNIDILINKLAQLYLKITNSLGSRILIKETKFVLQNLEIRKKN